MVNDGFHQDGQIYNDGGRQSVDWTNASILRDAISQGPVKIGIAADQLRVLAAPNGWFATGFHADNNEDHSISLCGYGPHLMVGAAARRQVPAGSMATGRATPCSPGTRSASSTSPRCWRSPARPGSGVPTTVIVGAQGTRIHVFARGGDGALWHIWQTAPNNGWSGWYSLGGWIDLITAATNQDGRLEVFARGGDGAVWHNWEVRPAATGAAGTRSAAGSTCWSRQERRWPARDFARGGDGALWHMWQTAPSNGWSGWYSLGGWIDLLDVARNADGRLEIFVRGGDGAVWHMWQTAPSNGWSGWYSLGGWIDMLDMARNADGRMEVFARGGDGALWQCGRPLPTTAGAAGTRWAAGSICWTSAGTPMAASRSSRAAATAPSGICGNRSQQRLERLVLARRLDRPARVAPTTMAGWRSSPAAATAPLAHVADRAQQRLERLVLSAAGSTCWKSGRRPPGIHRRARLPEVACVHGAAHAPPALVAGRCSRGPGQPRAAR